MGLSTFVLSIAVMLVMMLYASLKIIKWSINSDNKQLGGQYIEHLSDLFRLSVLVVVLFVFGPPLGDWATNAFHYTIKVIPL